MTHEEFKDKVSDILTNYNPEVAHPDTDELMEDLLVELGYGAGIEIIRKSTRWYA